MSCLNCNGGGKPDFTRQHRVCRVCALLDKDYSEKPVAWCDICSNYICKSDWDNWERRGRATALEWGSKAVEWINGKWNVIKKIWD